MSAKWGGGKMHREERKKYQKKGKKVGKCERKTEAEAKTLNKKTVQHNVDDDI